MKYNIILNVTVLISSPGLRAGDEIEFNRDIRPILSDNCFACHGPDKAKRKAKLRLDDRDSAVDRGAIAPGKLKESELIARILLKPEEDGAMPPPEMHKVLSAKQKELLAKWIEQGAKYQPHWAYVPIAKSAPPALNDPNIILKNSIDNYIAAELLKLGLTQSKGADKRTLIRRLYLDLLGYAPTPEAVEAFAKDDSPKAYENLVDELLANPAYGERMTVPWLDVVRFADTVGYHGDQNQRIFPYRDYVIDSFNKNKPFDQFTIEQIAGDLLPKPTSEQLVATGFNRLNMMTREGGAQPKEYLAKYQGDRVRTVSMAWLGSTMGCAECHDHKYDPFTAKDFYAMSAFFADVRQWGVYSDYKYTPNPDLKGWSNDHPFPPEIEVSNDYLLKAKQRVYAEADRLGELTFEAIAKSDVRRTTFYATWLKDACEALMEHEQGWRVQTPAAAAGMTVDKESRVLFTGKVVKGAGATLAVKPQPGWIAALKIDALPHARHGNKLTRDAAESATVIVSVTVKGSDGKEKKLPIYLATAEHYDVLKWNSTSPVVDLVNGWRTASHLSTQAQSAKFYLEKPFRLQAGEELIVTLKSDTIGCVKVSVSPFGVEPNSRVVEVLRKANADSPKSHAESDFICLVSTGIDGDLLKAAQQLLKRYSTYNGGKAWTQVTVATTPMPTRVLARGNFMDDTGAIVAPAVPAFLPGIANPDGKRLTRLDLAKWIVAKDNPLTARAFTNRLWKQFFGTGLSAGVEDLGGQGEWPTHPELLDFLAAEFRDTWDVKRTVKMIVMSHTYRQSSKANPMAKELDPANRLLSYLPPKRLEAEFIRDNALQISGLLNPDIGGPSSKPYQPAGYYANIQFPNRDYKADAGALQYRRGLYTHWQRTFLHPMLANFDAPSREECTANRTVANTPQQALTLLNDPTFVEAARVLAAKVHGSAKDDAERLQNLYTRVLSRTVKDSERDSLLTFLIKQREYYHANPAEAKKLLATGLAPMPATPDAAELAAWTAVCRVVLNLHETITRY